MEVVCGFPILFVIGFLLWSIRPAKDVPSITETLFNFDYGEIPNSSKNNTRFDDRNPYELERQQEQIRSAAIERKLIGYRNRKQ